MLGDSSDHGSCMLRSALPPAPAPLPAGAPAGVAGGSPAAGSGPAAAPLARAIARCSRCSVSAQPTCGHRVQVEKVGRLHGWQAPAARLLFPPATHSAVRAAHWRPLQRPASTQTKQTRRAGRERPPTCALAQIAQSRMLTQPSSCAAVTLDCSCTPHRSAAALRAARGGARTGVRVCVRTCQAGGAPDRRCSAGGSASLPAQGSTRDSLQAGAGWRPLSHMQAGLWCRRVRVRVRLHHSTGKRSLARDLEADGAVAHETAAHHHKPRLRQQRRAALVGESGGLHRAARGTGPRQRAAMARRRPRPGAAADALCSGRTPPRSHMQQVPQLRMHASSTAS